MENHPYGYRWALLPDPEEQGVIGRIGQMYFDKRISQYEIVRILNQEGVTCRGRPWNQPTISRIIKREWPADKRKDREHVLRRLPGWREKARAMESKNK